MLGGLFILILGCVVQCHGNQTDLLTTLFSNYQTGVRPLCGQDAPVQIKIGMAARQIIDIDEPKQLVTLNVWFRLKWNDCNLHWNASEYGGTENLILPYHSIWMPDLALYDNAVESIPGIQDYRPNVFSDGTVSYNFPTVITSMCVFDVRAFPFDTQRCALPLGSWAYHGYQVNVTNMDDSADLSTFLTNGEWDLVRAPAVRNELKYTCCEEPYPDVTFYLTLRRKPLFYVLNLLFPCIVISQMALLGFLLPVDSGEKTGLEITVLLSLAVFMMIISQSLPPTSENFPLIGIYFCLAIGMVTLSTILNVLVLNVHFRGQLGHRMPRWLRRVFLGCVARAVCVYPQGPESPVVCLGEKSDLMNGIGLYKSNKLTQNNQEKTTPEKEDPQLAPLTQVMKEQLSVLRKWESEREERKKTEKTEGEWKTLAVVMDRLFFVTLLAFSVVVTIAILLKILQEMHS